MIKTQMNGFVCPDRKMAAEMLKWANVNRRVVLGGMNVFWKKYKWLWLRCD